MIMKSDNEVLSFFPTDLESENDFMNQKNVPIKNAQCCSIDGNVKKKPKLHALEMKNYVAGELIWVEAPVWCPAVFIDNQDILPVETTNLFCVYNISDGKILQINPHDARTFLEESAQQLIREYFDHTSRGHRNKIKTGLTIIKILEECFAEKLEENNFKSILYFLNNCIVEDRRIILSPYPEIIQFEIRKMNYKNCLLFNQRNKHKHIDVITVFNEDLPTSLSLSKQQPGLFVAAKINEKTWLPGVIIDHDHLQKSQPSYACQYIMSFPNFEIYQVHHQNLVLFSEAISMIDKILYKKALDHEKIFLTAAKEYCQHYGLVRVVCEEQSDLFNHFRDIISKHKIFSNVVVKSENGLYCQSIAQQIKKGIRNFSISEREITFLNCFSDPSLTKPEPIDSLCLVCLKRPHKNMKNHPFFEGSICHLCWQTYKPKIFAFSGGGKSIFCVVCGDATSLIECDTVDCPRTFCFTCFKYLICPRKYEQIILDHPWKCCFCKPESRIYINSRIRINADWQSRENNFYQIKPIVFPTLKNRPLQEKIRVLAPFDGISCGLVALKRRKFVVEAYYAVENDPDAIQVSDFNHPEIKRFDDIGGDVRNLTEDHIKSIVPINLLIGGSPCQELSIANPSRGGLHVGTGKLFENYCNMLKWIKKHNPPNTPFFFIYENVASMENKYVQEISTMLECNPRLVDAKFVSGMHRARLFWSNLPQLEIIDKKRTLQDYLVLNGEALVKKALTITTQKNSLRQGKYDLEAVAVNTHERRDLKLIEIETLFGLIKHYTDVVADHIRLRLLGNAFSVDVIVEILRPLEYFFYTKPVADE